MSEASGATAPRDAATVVVARDGERGPEILLLKRNATVAFMASAWVFPGGRCDADDASDALAQYVVGATAAFDRATVVPDAVAAQALVATAVRECIEEAGIVLARGSASDVGRAAAQRDALQAGNITFVELLHDCELTIHASDLAHFAHWITPPFEKRRYDTRFFLARAPADQAGTHDAGETVDSMWIRPADAVSANNAGEITLPPPTLRALYHLARFDSVDHMFEWACAQVVAPIQPALYDDSGTMCLVFPGHAAHDAQYAIEPPHWAAMIDGHWVLRD